MNKVRGSLVLSLAIFLCSLAPAQAGPVEDWNVLTLACANRAGPTVLLDIALVQAAVHDAVQGVEHRFKPYAVDATPPAGTVNLPAAVAGAAWGVLVDTRICPAGTPRNNAQAAYNASLATQPASTTYGYGVGQQMLANYRAIPSPAPTYPGAFGPGEWQPTAYSYASMSFVYLATTVPFALNRPSQFRPPPPPPLTSQRYLRELEEVTLRGGVSSHPAAPDCFNGDPAQATADLARFWSGNFVAQWNQVTRDLSNLRITSIGDAARLFALVNIAGADAAIAVWDSKLFYHFWRPETAIAYTGNTTWVPFIRGVTPHFPQNDPPLLPVSQTPPYPDYVSGANGLTGAFTGMLRQYFGRDDIPFQIFRAVPSPVITCTNPREYSSFSAAAEEVVDARILLGIHFRSADEEARRLGERVAHWTFQKSLDPVPPGKRR